MNKLILLVSFSILIINLQAQEATAPSLQVGLSGIKFSKGDLDAALIAEIIAEKQKEVKTKLVKEMLLKNIGVDNGLFYAYIDNAIEIIANEKDESIRVKNLLENTVNLAFVISYTEYYLRTLEKDSDGWKNIKKLAFTYGIDTTVFEEKNLSLLKFTTIHYREKGEGEVLKKSAEASKKKARRNQFVGVLIDLVTEVIKNNEKLKTLGLLRTNYLQNAGAINAYLQLENDKTVEVQEFKDLNTLLNNSSSEQIQTTLKNALIIKNAAALTDEDIERLKEHVSKTKNSYETALEVLSVNNKSKVVSRNSFFKNENFPTVEAAEGRLLLDKMYKNKYGLLKSELESHSDKKVRDAFGIFFWLNEYKFKYELMQSFATVKAQAVDIYENVEENLDLHLKYFGLIKSLTAKGNNATETIDILNNVFKCDRQVNYQDLRKTYDTARNKITSLTNLAVEEKQALDQLNSFFEKLRYIEANRYEYLAQYERDIKPAINYLARYSNNFISLRDSLSACLQCITQTTATDLKKLNIKLDLAFPKLFSHIDEFNKVSTYDQFLNQLSEAGDIFSDDDMRSAINKVVTFIRSYIKVTENEIKEKTLTLDAEGFIMALQKLPYNKFKWVQFNFTVGVNNAAFLDPLTIYGSDDTLSLRNYSFIGEKIGIKIKLYDWKYVNSFSRGEPFTYYGSYYVRSVPPRDPTVSDVHILLYGSGLLYNFVNTGTTKDFNRPLIGTGLGITFFNDLDLNITAGKPILSDQPFFNSSIPWFVNVGFDIQFVEYYDRLAKKRKAKQTQKKLVEAANTSTN